MKNVFITGGTGFIGSCVVRLFSLNTLITTLFTSPADDVFKDDNPEPRRENDTTEP